MDYGGDSHQLPAVGSIDFADQVVFLGRTGIELVKFRRCRESRNQMAAMEVLQELASGIRVHVKAFRHVADWPRLFAIMPEEQQCFEVRHAVNLFENEAKYVRILVDFRHEILMVRSRMTWKLRAFQFTASTEACKGKAEKTDARSENGIGAAASSQKARV